VCRAQMQELWLPRAQSHKGRPWLDDWLRRRGAGRGAAARPGRSDRCRRPAADKHDAVAAQEHLRQPPRAPLLPPAGALHLDELGRRACARQAREKY